MDEICGNCINYYHCKALIYSIELNDTCDFNPSKFKPNPNK